MGIRIGIGNIFKMICLLLITLAKADEPLEDQSEMKSVNLDVKKSVVEAGAEKLSRQSVSLWPNIEQDQDLLLLELVMQDIGGGRGKYQKYKKLAKFMYPLFMGVLVAKIILVPLILKMLTAISASAVVMSKIALITTGYVALRWIFSGSVYDTKDHLEFIYLPPASHGKPYRSASGDFSLWDDQTWSDSENRNVAVTGSATKKQQQKYIPVKIKYELPYKSHSDGPASVTGSTNSIKDLYYYSQHNYNNNNNVGKPFL